MNYNNETDVRIAPDTVREQLATILNSESFVRPRRMQRFLEFIVDETLAGRADQIGEYSIGLTVFDRGTDFEPALDPIVRNDARRLRLKLSEYYGLSHSTADQVVIEIPKGGYVPVFTPVRSSKSRRLAVLPFEVEQRLPLVLYHFEELSYEEIAQQLDVSLAKVKTDIFRARAALAKVLAERGVTAATSLGAP